MPTDTTNTPPPTPPHAEQPGRGFFDWMRGLGIVRQPGWIGGVCAGVAARLGIDAIIVRGIVVVLAIFGGPALLLYAAAWLLLPDADDNIHLERLIRGEFTPPVIGVGVLFLLALLPIGGFWSAGPALWLNPGNWNAGFWGGPGHLVWVLAVIGAIVWFVVWASRRSRDTNAWPPTGAQALPQRQPRRHLQRRRRTSTPRRSSRRTARRRRRLPRAQTRTTSRHGRCSRRIGSASTTPGKRSRSPPSAHSHGNERTSSVASGNSRTRRAGRTG